MAPSDANTRLAPAIAIVGPTGSGKTELSLHLARQFNGEIINCDSVQIFRHFDIGSAKLPESARERIPHHLIDIAEPTDLFTAGDYARAGRTALREIAARHQLPVISGGTGFYLRVLIDGLAPGPQRDEKLRDRLGLKESRRPGSLHKLLARFDPPTAARIHPNDQPKVMRALEICLGARSAATSVFAAGRDSLTGFRVLKIGLFPDRETLYERLAARMQTMFDAGLIEETAAILARGVPDTAKPFESIGYRQALQHLKHELTKAEALFYATRETRRYAKRQMTWFRQEPGLIPLSGFGDDPAIIERASLLAAEFLALETI